MFNLVILIGTSRATSTSRRRHRNLCATSGCDDVYIGKDEGGTRKQGDRLSNVVFFRKMRVRRKPLKKGRSVVVTGRMRTSSWDDAGQADQEYKPSRRRHGRLRRTPTTEQRSGLIGGGQVICIVQQSCRVFESRVPRAVRRPPRGLGGRGRDPRGRLPPGRRLGADL